MNNRKENPNYVHGVYHIPREGEKERKKGEWKHPCAEKKRKEKETYGGHIS